MIRVEVPLGDRSYPVLVGDGARHELASVLPPEVRRTVVVTQESVGVEVDSGVTSHRLIIGEGEPAKCLATVEELCRQFARVGLTRKDCVVAVGGGLVTDVAGFAAAVYHRGTPVVHVATTLLAQVDAAIGGKTGVNLSEGKNLVGAFWQPAAVLCDTGVLAGLPRREYLSGSGEMAKYHFLGGRVGMGGVDVQALPLDERVAYCVELKARVVAADEREGGLRNILNYGHTLGHALEVGGAFGLRHGEAVAIGLHFAARLAYRLGRIDEARINDHVAVLRAYGLPSELPADADPEGLLTLMRRDKKAMNGLTFVLDGPTGVEVVPDIDPSEVIGTLEEMSS